MELETLNLLSAAIPDHGLKKAIERFQQIQLDKESKKRKPKGDQLTKYSNWISKEKGGNYRNDADFSRSC